MRLINSWTFGLEEFDEGDTPQYAILSHTWEEEEVTYRDMQVLEVARDKWGFTKIWRACELATEQDLKYVWIDTW